MDYFSRLLKENEVLIIPIRKHPLAFLKPGALTMLALILPFFLMFFLFRYETIGLVIFILLLILGLILLIKLIKLWYFNVIVLTDTRIIIIRQRGLFDRQVMEIEYEKIHNIAYRIKGIKQTIFRFGSIKIQLQGNEKPLIINQVSKPQQLQQLLLKIKSQKELGDDQQIVV